MKLLAVAGYALLTLHYLLELLETLTHPRRTEVVTAPAAMELRGQQAPIDVKLDLLPAEFPLTGQEVVVEEIARA